MTKIQMIELQNNIYKVTYTAQNILGSKQKSGENYTRELCIVINWEHAYIKGNAEKKTSKHRLCEF